MTSHRAPFPGRRVRRLVLLLAWLLAGPAHAEQHAPSVGEAAGQAFRKIVEARGQARAQRYPEALKQLDEAASLAEELEDRLPLALAFHNRGEVHLLRGELQDAWTDYHRALGVYAAMGHMVGAGLVQRRIGALSRLLEKSRGMAEAPVGARAGALSPIDQAVERVRRRARAAGEAAESGPVRVTWSEPAAAKDYGEWAYVESLRRKIGSNTRYPDHARRTGQEGTVDVVFAVRRSGEVANLELSKSSGVILLDLEALRNVSESAPFDPVPDGVAAAAPLTVRLTLSYRLPAAPDRTH